LKVLFISSGNDKFFKIVPFIASQAQSLRENGVEVDSFLIQKKGAWGYFLNIFKLRKFLKENKYDILHAHYILSAWVTVLTLSKTPIVVSLMGDDAYGTYTGYKRVNFSSLYLPFLTLLIQPFVNGIISKSKNIEKFVYRKKISFIIPNGVKIEDFILPRENCRKELGLMPGKKYILFLGDKNNIRKNFRLVKTSINQLADANAELLSPYPVKHEQVAKYLNAVDVFLFTSFSEGSPNAVKEAMACNCPIVATDVGDVKWLLGQLDGHYLVSFNPQDVVEKLKAALKFSQSFGRTKGRDRLISLGLNIEFTAKRVIEIYEACRR